MLLKQFFLPILFASFTYFSDPSAILKALESGNATVLSSHLDNFIDLSLPNKDNMSNVSKNQASMALKSYYDEMGIQKFSLTSKREAGSIMYITGKLHGKVKNESITIILKNNNSKHIITSLRIGS